MTNPVLTTDELRAVQPSAVARALSRLGWAPVRPLESHQRPLSAWFNRSLDPDGLNKMLVPADAEYDDYPLRLRQLIHDVAAIQPDTVRTFVLEITTPLADILRFRSEQETPADGSIPFVEGVELIESVKGALAASAKAAKHRQPYFGKAERGLAQKYLNAARLGQTEKGSFVVTVISDLGAHDSSDNELASTSEPPFSREVNVRLFQALTAARAAAEAYRSEPNEELFHAAVAEGVSADLCSSLVGMVRLQDSLSIDIDWSPAMATPQVPDRVDFTRDLVDPLKSAVEQLSAVTERSGVRIRGIVKRLDRERTYGAGQITIKGAVPPGRKRQSIHVHLDEPDYRVAATAHRAGREIRIVGDLEGEGSSIWLRNPRNLEDIRPGRQMEMYDSLDLANDEEE